MLAERYRPAAFHLACVIVCDASEAEDVTQEALLKAYVALPRFLADAPFRPWLLQIVANEARNRRRSAGRRLHLASRVAAVSARQVEPSPEVATLADEQRRLLLAEVNALRDEDRMAIAGRYFLDLSEAEIADLLGCARGTVKSRVSRSLAKLRERLTAREAVALAIVLALLALGLIAWPEAREAIADRLGLRGVSITHVRELPTLQPLVVPASLGLGSPVTHEVAVQRLGRDLLIPGALGEPDAVYAQSGEVWLVYAPRATLPPSPSAPGLGLLLTEFSRTGFDPVFLTKGLAPNTELQEVQVVGQRGVWISGAPHVFFRETANRVTDAPPRLAGNTLLWEQAALTLRIESALDRVAAVRVAESIR